MHNHEHTMRLFVEFALAKGLPDDGIAMLHDYMVLNFRIGVLDNLGEDNQESNPVVNGQQLRFRGPAKLALWLVSFLEAHVEARDIPESEWPQWVKAGGGLPYEYVWR